MKARPHPSIMPPPIRHGRIRGDRAGSRLLRISGAPLYVVHVTCEEAVEQLALGRAKGFPVMGETCTQYLFVFEEDLARPGYEGAKYVCSPPVRQPKDAAVLWKALADGGLQAISTDHCPFWFEGGVKGRIAGKELGREGFHQIPNGMPGIEDRMPVMWHAGVGGGHYSANRFVEITSTNPAKIFGPLSPQRYDRGRFRRRHRHLGCRKRNTRSPRQRTI